MAAIAAEEFYKACNLRGNPFRSNPAHSSDPRTEIWVGYEKQQQQLVRFLERTRADQVGNANFVMVYGNYGTGKSHALLWAQNHILKTEKVEFDSVCYFVPTLKKDKGKLTFAGAFIDDLLAKSTLLADVQSYRNFLGPCIFQYRKENNIPLDVNEETIIERMIPAVELSNFAKDIFRVDGAPAIRSLLAPRGLTDYQAVTTFTRLANLFVTEIPLDGGSQRFKKAVYLFVDELDDLLRAPVKDTREVNDMLRHLYDSCPNAFCLVIALSAQSAEFTAIFEDFVLTRIQRRIELPLLDKADAVEFVRSVLDNSRVDEDGPRDFYPFDKSAVDAVASQLVEITPRKVVNTMQQVLEEVRLSGIDPRTTLITISELDTANILEEVLGEGGIL